MAANINSSLILLLLVSAALLVPGAHGDDEAAVQCVLALNTVVVPSRLVGTSFLVPADQNWQAVGPLTIVATTLIQVRGSLQTLAADVPANIQLIAPRIEVLGSVLAADGARGASFDLLPMPGGNVVSANPGQNGGSVSMNGIVDLQAGSCIQTGNGGAGTSLLVRPCDGATEYGAGNIAVHGGSGGTGGNLVVSPGTPLGRAQLVLGNGGTGSDVAVVGSVVGGGLRAAASGGSGGASGFVQTPGGNFLFPQVSGANGGHGGLGFVDQRPTRDSCQSNAASFAAIDCSLFDGDLEILCFDGLSGVNTSSNNPTACVPGQDGAPGADGTPASLTGQPGESGTSGLEGTEAGPIDGGAGGPGLNNGGNGGNAHATGGCGGSAGWGGDGGDGWPKCGYGGHGGDGGQGRNGGDATATGGLGGDGIVGRGGDGGDATATGGDAGYGGWTGNGGNGYLPGTAGAFWGYAGYAGGGFAYQGDGGFGPLGHGAPGESDNEPGATATNGQGGVGGSNTGYGGAGC